MSVESEFNTPTLETCKELSKIWQKQTLFVIYLKDNVKCIAFTKEFQDFHLEHYYAPQIQELLDALRPILVARLAEHVKLDNNHNSHHARVSFFGDGTYFSLKNAAYHYAIQELNSNYTDCLAKLYISIVEDKHKWK